jgi:hypothetical protein
MRTPAGPGNLHCDGNAKLVARPLEGLDIVAPLGLVEVDREEVAGVVFQQGVDTDRVQTRKMVVDDRIRQGDQ